METEWTHEETEMMDAYLRKELSRTGLMDFENKLLNNPKLQAKVKELRLMQLAIGEVGLESELEVFYSEQNIEGPEKKSKWWRLTGVAAAIVFILGLTIYFVVNQREETLYTQYYKPDPGLMTVMGTSDHYDFQKAMVNYKSGQYTSSIHDWQLQLKAAPENDTLLYFIGAAYQASETMDSAKTYLQKVSHLPQSTFQKDANWYLGLIYLQDGQPEKAIEYLKKSNHAKKESLIQLIKKQ